jgi:hypothetical protein
VNFLPDDTLARHTRTSPVTEPGGDPKWHYRSGSSCVANGGGLADRDGNPHRMDQRPSQRPRRRPPLHGENVAVLAR